MTKTEQKDRMLTALLDALPLYVVVARKSDGGVLYANRRAIERFAPAHVEPNSLATTEFFTDITDRKSILDRIENAGPLDDIEVEIKLPDGSTALIASFSAPIEFEGEPAVVSAFSDVTSRRESTARMRAVHKMEALRRLSGGIAHELNNALVPVMTFADLALDEVPADSPASVYLEKVVVAANRATELTQKVLEYSRPKPAVHERIELGRLAAEARDLLRTCVPYRIAVDLEVADADKVFVHTDRTTLRDLILNITLNAADEIGRGAGVIQMRVGTEAAEPGHPARAALTITARPREKGERGKGGVDLDAITDAPGRAGEAVGLGVIHGIAASLGGEIAVEAEPGVQMTTILRLATVQETPAETGGNGVAAPERGAAGLEESTQQS